MKVGIVGAGIGGLTTAIALSRVGIEAQVFERAPEFLELGAGITLWPNATRVLIDLGLGDALSRKGRRFERGFIRTPDGNLLSSSSPAASERQLNAPAIAIHRADLHALLADALPDHTVQLGAECQNVIEHADGIELQFANGAAQNFDVVVGADGIRSVIRRHVLGDVALRYSGYTAWRGVATRADVAETSETWGCGARFGIVPLADGRVYWFATKNTPPSSGRSSGQRKENPRQLFRQWHDPIGPLIEATPDDAILHNDIYDIPPLGQWSRGRTVLLGDAAHPTTPNLGQGACMAIESAYVLAGELTKGGDSSAAFQRYERRRMPRTARITNESWKIGRIAQIENRVACALRNLAVRLTPSSVAEKQILRIVSGNI